MLPALVGMPPKVLGFAMGFPVYVDQCFYLPEENEVRFVCGDRCVLLYGRDQMCGTRIPMYVDSLLMHFANSGKSFEVQNITLHDDVLHAEWARRITISVETNFGLLQMYLKADRDRFFLPVIRDENDI